MIAIYNNRVQRLSQFVHGLWAQEAAGLTDAPVIAVGSLDLVQPHANLHEKLTRRAFSRVMMQICAD